MGLIAKAAHSVRCDYPNVKFHLFSGDSGTISERLNLLYNMSLLVEEGLGYAVSLDKIINTTGNSNLCFRPLYPELISHLDIAWKKYQVFPKCAEIFLKRLQEII